MRLMSELYKLYRKNCNESLLKYLLLCPKDLRLNCGERGVGGKKATDFLLEDDFFTLFMMVSPFFAGLQLSTSAPATAEFPTWIDTRCQEQRHSHSQGMEIRYAHYHEKCDAKSVYF